MSKKQKKSKGFTLIELTIVIGIISILSMIVTPLISKTIPNYRLKGTAKDIFSNMQKAKLEAIRQNANVIITYTTGTYTKAGGVGSYSVFVDNGDGGGTADNDTRDGSETILFSGTMPKDVSLFTTTFAADSTGFNGQGLPISWGSVQVRNTNRWYRITVSSAGYIKLDISSNGITGSDGTIW